MKIEQLWIAAFGKLKQVRLKLDSGANIFYGVNETGKSTVMAFVKAMLYGFPARSPSELRRNDRKRYAPWSGTDFGGSIIFEKDERRYVIERTFGMKRTQDALICRDGDTGEVIELDPNLTLGEQFLGLNVDDFENSLLIKQQEIRRSNSSSIAQLLDQVSASQAEQRNTGAEAAVGRLRLKRKIKSNPRGKGGVLESLEAEISALNQRRQIVLADAVEERRTLNNIFVVEAEIAEVEEKINYKRKCLDWLEAQKWIARGNQVEAVRHALHDIDNGTSKETGVPMLPASVIDDIYSRLNDLKDVNRELRTNDVNIETIMRRIDEQEANREAILQIHPLADRATIPDFNRDFTLPRPKLRTGGEWGLLIMLALIVALAAAGSVFWLSKSVVLAIALFVTFSGAGAVGLAWRRNEDLRSQNRYFKAQEGFQKHIEQSEQRWREQSYRYQQICEDETELKNALEFCYASQKKLQTEFARISLEIKGIASPYVDDVDPFVIDQRLSNWQKESRDYDLLQTQKERLEHQLEVILDGTNQESIMAQRAKAHNTVDSIAREFPRVAAELSQENISAESLQQEYALLQKERQDLSYSWGSSDALMRRFESNSEQLADIDKTIECIEQKRQKVLADVAAIDLAISWVEQASQEQARNWLPKLTAISHSFLERFCKNRFEKIGITRELQPTMVEKDSASWRETDFFSGATVDQIELSLRFATAQSILPEGEVVVLLDDSFVQFDSDREDNAIQLLSELSLQGWQTLLFTCKAQTLKTALNQGFNLVELQHWGGVGV